MLFVSSADYSISMPTQQCIWVPTTSSLCVQMILVCIFLNMNDVDHNSMYLTGHSCISFGAAMPDFLKTRLFPLTKKLFAIDTPWQRKSVFSNGVPYWIYQQLYRTGCAANTVKTAMVFGGLCFTLAFLSYFFVCFVGFFLFVKRENKRMQTQVGRIWEELERKKKVIKMYKILK